MFAVYKAPSLWYVVKVVQSELRTVTNEMMPLRMRYKCILTYVERGF